MEFVCFCLSSFPLCFSFLLSAFFSFLLATSFECSDRQLGDVSSALVPRRSGQLLSPGQKNKKFLIPSNKEQCSSVLYSRPVVGTVFMLLGDSGEGHDTAPRGGQGGPDPASRATGRVWR